MAEQPQSLAKGSATMLLSMIAGGGLAILISIVAARQLNVSSFGLYSLIISIQGVVGLFAAFSMNTALAKHVSEYSVRSPTEAITFAKVGMSIVLLFSTICCAFYTVLAGVIGEGLYENADIVVLVPFSALVVFSVAFNGTAFGIVQGCQRIRLLAFIRVGSPLLSLAAMMVLIGSLQIKGVLVGLFIGQMSIAGIALIVLNSSGFPLLSRGASSWDKKVAKKLFAYAVPATLMGVVIAPVMWLGNTELTVVAGLDAMGIFAIAFLFYQVLVTIPNSVIIPLIPRVSQLSVESLEEMRKTVVNATKTMSVLLFPLVFGVALFAKPIIQVLYGSSYSDASESVYLMCAASYFFAQGAMTGATIAGLGRMWVGLSLNVVWACAFLILAFSATPIWGADGLSFSYAVSFFLYLIAAFAASRHYLKVDLGGTYVSSGLAALIILAGFLLFVEPIHLGWVEKAIALLVGSGLMLWADKSVIGSVLSMIRR